MKRFFTYILLLFIFSSLISSPTSLEYSRENSGYIKYEFLEIKIGNTTYGKGEVILTFNSFEQNRRYVGLNIKIATGNNTVVDETFFIDIMTRNVYIGDRNLGKTSFFINTPIYMGEQLFFINRSSFRIDTATIPINITVESIQVGNILTNQGVQRAYEIYYSYVLNTSNSPILINDVLIYDFDTGILIGYPNPVLCPELIYLGVWDVTFIPMRVQEIEINVDLGPPVYPMWVVTILTNWPSLVIISLLSVTTYFLFRRRKRRKIWK